MSCEKCGGEVKYFGHLLGGFRCRNYCPKHKRLGVDKMVYVEIVEKSSGEVVERMGPMSEAAAKRVKAGVSINLNRAEYFTRIV
jgi:hypothetical protein